jgi:hypothetical protein
MIRKRLVVLLAVGLTGCGGGATPGALPVGFANHTQHANADLWTIWKAAQQSLSQQIDLNPLQRTLYGSPPDSLPGDPRALQVMPRQLSVGSAPDVASRLLLAATGVDRPDPTGLIACPQPCNVQYAAAYSEYQPQITRYAASWEFQGDNFSLILQYEFENQILAALGYSLRWR